MSRSDEPRVGAFGLAVDVRTRRSSLWSPEEGQEMGRMEIITRTERRRTYSEAEKAAMVAEAPVPGVTVREVPRCT